MEEKAKGLSHFCGQGSDLACVCLYGRQCGNVFTISDSVFVS